jgi:hypothetical protein
MRLSSAKEEAMQDDLIAWMVLVAVAAGAAGAAALLVM